MPPPSDEDSRTPGHPRETETVSSDDGVPELESASISAGEFRNGTVVAGRYEIVRFLAHGGMGAVYEAFDRMLSERVALKTVLPQIAANPKSTERFRREIQIARRVSHRNVCRIHDVGEHSIEGERRSILFLTMELLRGESLKSRLERPSPMPAEEIRSIALQMAAGLAAAHVEGVIHRDFKPANVMLTLTSATTGASRVVVSDFGLAKAAQEGSGFASLSGSNELVGTPAYMSPDQVLGEELTPASDVYAFGLVLYEMFSGVCPFADAGSPIGVAMRRLQSEPPPIRALVPEIAESWADLIGSCLARHAADRPASGSELVRILESLGDVGVADSALLPRPGVVAFHTAPTLATPISQAIPRDTRPAEAAVQVQRRGGSFATVWPRGEPWNRSRWRLAAILAAAIVLSVGMGVVAMRKLRTPASSPPTQRTSVHVSLHSAGNSSDLPPWISQAVGTAAESYFRAIDGVRPITESEVADLARLLHRQGELDLGGAELLLRKPAPTFLGSSIGVQATLEPGGVGALVRLRLSAERPDRPGQRLEGSATGDPTRPFDLVARAAESLLEGLGLPRPSSSSLSEARSRLPQSGAAVESFAAGLHSARAGDWQAAESELRGVVEQEPAFPFAPLELARVLKSLGRPDESRQVARNAIPICAALPGSTRFECEARGLELIGDRAGAARLLLESSRGAEDWVGLGVRIAELQLAANQIPDAEAALERLRTLPPPLDSDPRIAATLARVLYRKGEFKLLSDLATQMAAAARELEAPFLEARANYLMGVALQEQGQLEPAVAMFERSRGTFSELAERGETAKVIEALAATFHAKGDASGAERLLRAALSEHEKLGDRLSAAKVQNNLGLLLREQSRFDDAKSALEDALAVFRAESATFETSACLFELGATAHQEGDLDRARRYYEEALSGSTAIDDKSGIAIALTNLGEVLYEQGDLEGASRLHEDALAIDRQLGDRSAGAYESYRLGLTALARGEIAVARRELESARKTQSELGESLSAAQTDLGLAEVAIRSNDLASAIQKAEAAEELFRAEAQGDLTGQAAALLARAQLATGSTALAQAALARARSAVGASSGLRSRGEVCLAAAVEIRSSPANTSAGTGCLDLLEQEARSSGHRLLALELSLGRARVEIASGAVAKGQDRLSRILAEARELRLDGISRQVTELSAGLAPIPAR